MWRWRTTFIFEHSNIGELPIFKQYYVFQPRRVVMNAQQQHN